MCEIGGCSWLPKGVNVINYSFEQWCVKVCVRTISLVKEISSGWAISVSEAHLNKAQIQWGCSLYNIGKARAKNFEEDSKHEQKRSIAPVAEEMHTREDYQPQALELKCSKSLLEHYGFTNIRSVGARFLWPLTIVCHCLETLHVSNILTFSNEEPPTSALNLAS